MTIAFRNTMTDLVEEVRRLIGDPKPSDTDDEPATWLDVDIQDALDDHRLDVYREPLSVQPTYTSTGVQYLVYCCPHTHFEITSGGTAIFFLETASGTNAGTADYTADYRQGIFTFTADQGGSAYYLTGRSYDVYGAAAAVLDWWVARDPADCLTDGDGRRYFDRTRATARAKQAETYRSKSRPTYAALARGDVT